VKQLLVHLPLLQPGNHAAREEYLNILPNVLSHSHSKGIQEEECRQLLSLALVHPAFSADERSRLQEWLEILNDKSVGGFYDSKINEFPQAENVSRRMDGWQRHQRLVKKDSGIGGSFEYHFNPPGLPPTAHPNPPIGHPKIQKTQSLQPDRITNGVEDVISDSPEVFNRPGRSLSFPVDPQKFSKIPLSPQSSFESETDEANSAAKISNFPENPNPGMKGKHCFDHPLPIMFPHLSSKNVHVAESFFLRIVGSVKSFRALFSFASLWQQFSSSFVFFSFPSCVTQAIHHSSVEFFLQITYCG
jgi:hypothetical protein